MTRNHEKRFDGMKMAMADESQLSCLNEEHKFEKTIYKRRSSIFRRRSVTCDRQDSQFTLRDTTVFVFFNRNFTNHLFPSVSICIKNISVI